MSFHELQYRSFEKKDAARLSEIANNPKIAQNMRDNFPHPYSLSDAKNFIRQISLQHDAKVWAVCLDEQLIGAIGIHPQQDVMRYSAEIGYWIAEEYWGRGITTQILSEMVPAIFETMPLERIYAVVFESNPASIKVLEKVGFIKEGTLRRAIFKNGAFQDAEMMAILRGEGRGWKVEGRG